MELRLLSTAEERALFARNMIEARATRGTGFREKKRSLVGEIHLSFAQLYALFDEESAHPDEMLSGFAMHSLASFTQTYPLPDLTRYRPNAVIECGELWSKAKGAGILARRGMAVLSGLLQTEAILCYPVVKPWDGTQSYKEALFKAAGEPILWPYVETLDAQDVWVQALVLEGADLRRLVNRAWQSGFETSDRHRRIRFENPFSIKPELDVVAKSEQQTNGAAHS